MAKLPRIVAALALVAASSFAVVGRAAGASTVGSVTVANRNDSGPGSLRQAIADASPGETVIVPAGTYVLATGELAIAKSLTISGAGAAMTIIDAQTASRVFHTSGAGNQIAITGVTIRDGKTVPPPGTALAEGGGVRNDGATVTLSDDVITANQADADARGRNGTGGDAAGGGVFSSGTLNLVDTDIRGNSATANGGSGQPGGAAEGGGVVAAGAVSVRGSTFEDNLADARGGQGPVSPNQRGGTAEGGGLEIIEFGASSVSASTFDHNVADGSAGPGASGGLAAGGAALLENGARPLLETNVTFTDNVAQALAGQTLGGAIFFDGDSPGELVRNATLSANSATSGITNLGGNIYVGVDDALEVENTLITAGAADPGSENCGAAGPLASIGHNLDSHDQCGFHATGDLVNRDPSLGALADNGGRVRTLALNPGSPAIDAAAAIDCPAADARGVLRPAGGRCDIGAFELATPTATTTDARAIGPSSATLTGTASNPDLATGTAVFEYGTTTSYGTSTQAQSLDPTTADAKLSTSLGELAPATTYHFRLFVHNAAGTVTGNDQTFVTASPQGTQPPPPAGTGTSSPPVTHATPRIGNLKLVPTVISPKRGAVISYTDTEAAITAFSPQHLTTGRVRGRSCVAPSKQNRTRKRCTRWVNIGHPFTHSDTQGHQRLHLPISAIAELPPGKYRLTATPHAGRIAGRTTIVGFQIARG